MEGIGGVIKRRASDQGGRKPSRRKDHLPGIEMPETRREKYIHSPEHALAAEISAYFAERKKFAVYLGIIKRMGMAQARTLFSSIKSDDTNVRSPRKFFMWLSKSGTEGVTPPKPRQAKASRKKRPGKQLDMGDFLG